ncbi:hypothetical protein ASD75_10950 [Acidovorax sp. Root568]|nr:hypothetical protein ASD75_10950 [Acidovorax sp. Root568]
MIAKRNGENIEGPSHRAYACRSASRHLKELKVFFDSVTIVNQRSVTFEQAVQSSVAVTQNVSFLFNVLQKKRSVA